MPIPRSNPLAKSVCVLDEHRLLTGVDNWVNETVRDVNLVFITHQLQTLLSSMYFPTDLVYVTVAGKYPPMSLESRIRLLSRSAKVIALVEYEVPDVIKRAKAAGAVGVIGAQRPYRSIVDFTREILWGRPKTVEVKLTPRELAQALTWEEAEVLRLHKLGTAPLLIGGAMNKPYEQVQKLLATARAKTSAR